MFGKEILRHACVRKTENHGIYNLNLSGGTDGSLPILILKTIIQFVIRLTYYLLYHVCMYCFIKKKVHTLQYI